MHIVPALASVGLLASCSNGEEPPMTVPDGVIRVSAAISGNSTSRGYQAFGEVESGTFYLTYNNVTASPLYQVGTVSFINGTGFITAPSGNELAWMNVGYDPSGSKSEVTFYLDNVPLSESDPSAILIELPETNPYRAGLFDYTTGSNDLLWGSAITEIGKEVVPMTLHHAMAMLRVEITVDASAEGSLELDLNDAAVEIRNILQAADCYDRLTGTLRFPENPEIGPLSLVTPATQEWKNKDDFFSGGKIVKYTTADFVMPPQELLAGELRPQLRITVPQGEGMDPKVYSGYLPRAMTVETSTGSYAANFSFLREHVMTLRINMNPDIMELEFMPVTVQEWVNKGTYLASGTQAAIFSDEDFYAMIRAYNSGVVREIERYGFLRDGQWIFNIYSDLNLDFSQVFGLMPLGDVGYAFQFNGQTVVVENNGESLELTEKKGAEALCQILDGSYN